MPKQRLLSDKITIVIVLRSSDGCVRFVLRVTTVLSIVCFLLTCRCLLVHSRLGLGMSCLYAWSTLDSFQLKQIINLFTKVNKNVEIRKEIPNLEQLESVLKSHMTS